MEREIRYYVCKIKDAKKYLSPRELQGLWNLLGKIAIGRANDHRRMLVCVCVEDDWPEYEPVWKMIEARVDRKPAGKCDICGTRPLAPNSGMCKECGEELDRCNSKLAAKCTCDETHYCGCDDREYAAKLKSKPTGKCIAPTFEEAVEAVDATIAANPLQLDDEPTGKCKCPGHYVSSFSPRICHICGKPAGEGK